MKIFRPLSAAAIVLTGALLANSALALEAITYFHNDISGTPLLATDQAGNVVWKEVYRPYGEKLNNLAASSNNSIWFAGKPYDSNTGLSYMGARYYDPVIGRFTGIDPKGFDPNNIHSFNRYAYANNNPYKFVDPDGRVAVPAVFIGLTFVAVAVEIRSLPGQIQTVSRAFDAVRNAIRSDSVEAAAPADGAKNGKKDTLRPGEHAGESVPARGPGRDFTSDERNQINDIGQDTGCHTCGTKVPGTKSGNFVPDHQPPNAVNPTGGAQELYPQCITCSRTQGGQIRGQQVNSGE